MDDATGPRSETTAPKTAPCVEAEDINAIYNLLLRREHEGGHIFEVQRGRPLESFFYAVLNSPEYCGAILPGATGRGRWPRYRGRLTFDRLRAWIRRRSIFSPDLTGRLVAAVSWRDLHRELLKAPEVLARSPQLRALGAGLVADDSGASGEQDAAEIDGDCDYINIWEIKGWCVNLLDGSDRATVEILVGGEVVGSAVCSDYRRDVQGRFGGDGACGFTFVIPSPVRETLRQERWITVRERATRAPIGVPVSVRYHGPNRLDLFDALEAEAARARKSLERLEAQLAEASATLGFPLSAYDAFVRAQTPPSESSLAARLNEAFEPGSAPRVTVVILGGVDGEALNATLESLTAQAFPHWDLVLPGAPPPKLERRLKALAAAGHSVSLQDGDTAVSEGRLGGFLLTLLAGDRLSPDALLEMAIAAKPGDVAAVYCDEDTYEISGGGDIVRSNPRLKPRFDLDYLLADNYVGRAVMFRTATVAELGGFAKGPGEAGSLDLLLRIHESHGGNAISHCPGVLLHTPRRADGPPEGAMLQVVSDHLARTTPGAVAVPHEDPYGGVRSGALRIIWPLPARAPSVSIIIPTRDHPELIGPCLAALRPNLSDYPGEVEIFVVDNGTTEPIASAVLSALSEAGAIRLARYPGPFNWSALNNRAVAEAKGQILVFLNNDIITPHPGWLSELVGQALRPQVGAVGARLLYGDLSIQHAGMVVGVAGATRHEGVGQSPRGGGYLGRTQLQHQTGAVTGACLATRREVFEKLGGFDEAAFKVAFNDTDYCMRLGAAGLAVVYSPFATLLHFESVSRGLESAPAESAEGVDEITLFRERWRDALRTDRNYNPLFDRTAQPFTYLAPPRRLV